MLVFTFNSLNVRDSDIQVQKISVITFVFLSLYFALIRFDLILSVCVHVCVCVPQDFMCRL